jgi:MOSC domain-containing protein YiiM
LACITIRAVPASILQINISKGGVPKRPTLDAQVTALGIEGDLHAHPEIHGGPTKALLLITAEGTEELKQMGFPLFHGALGENITTSGLDRRSLRIGQRWRIGQEVVVELTRVRTPCLTIEAYGSGMGASVYDREIQAGDTSSPRWGLSGFYAAVVEPGRIYPGDPISLLDQALLDQIV